MSAPSTEAQASQPAPWLPPVESSPRQWRRAAPFHQVPGGSGSLSEEAGASSNLGSRADDGKTIRGGRAPTTPGLAVWGVWGTEGGLPVQSCPWALDGVFSPLQGTACPPDADIC